MNVRYIVLTDGYAADNVQLLASSTTILGAFNISSSNPLTKTVTISSFNITGGVSSFVSIAGMNILSSANNLLDLGVTLTLPDAVTLQFTVTSTSSTSTLLEVIALTYIVFNTGYFNRPNFAAFQLGDLSGFASSTARLLQAPSSSSLQLNDPNANPSTTLVGMNKASVSHSNFFNYNVSFGTNSFSVTSQNPNNRLGVSYLMLPTYYCDILTPYKVVGQDTCVAQCPSGYVTNDQTLTCDVCSAWCASCTNGQCTQCSSGYLLANGACYTSCPVGFYQHSTNNVCVPCSTGCAFCTSSVCSHCHSAYYLNSTTSTCNQCSTGCV